MKKLEISDRNDSPPPPPPPYTHTLYSVSAFIVYFNGCHVYVMSHQFPKCFLIVHTSLLMDSDILVLYPASEYHW